MSVEIRLGNTKKYTNERTSGGEKGGAEEAREQLKGLPERRRTSGSEIIAGLTVGDRCWRSAGVGEISRLRERPQFGRKGWVPR